MKPLQSFASTWLHGLRWRELVPVVVAAYMGGTQLADYVHADPAKSQQVGVILAAVAGVCYVLNPKYAEWVKVLPHADTDPPAASPVPAVDPGQDAFSTPEGAHSDV